MNPLLIGLLGLVLLLSLLLLRMPIGLSMAITGFLGFCVLSTFKAGFSLLGLVTYQTASNYTLTVIPLFILMGQFAGHSRMGADLYQGVYRWIGFLPGGLAMATVAACAGFAAVSGSSLATATTMGMVALPEMKRFGYDDRLATGSVAAGGTLGILIPPSTVMVIYGILTEQPIGTLFVAGILPGLLLSALFLITIYILTVRNPELGPPGPRFSLRERIGALRSMGGILGLFILVVGGLYAGWFTPTEAAGIGAFGALLVTLIKRRLNRENLPASLSETTLTTAMIFLILIGANIFGYFLAVSQIPEWVIHRTTSLGMNRYLVLGVVCLVYMVLGCLMEGLAIMVITLPVIYPMMMNLGFDPIWFGVVITLFMEMSLITPPVGMNVFLISGVARDVPMVVIFRGIMPFFLAMVLCLVLLILAPQIALFLPGTMSR
ncbi:MAG: TRAP transporter large permease [Deltaproteobacteria bacterium]|nr:TRAP transporter large permease [Deltaproteobacteria bacterium]